MSLVTFDQAMAHVNMTTPPTETTRLMNMQFKLQQAEALVLDYCNSTAHWRVVTETWTSETVPVLVQAAILEQFAELLRFAGNDPDGQGPALTRGGLAPHIENILWRHKDPVVI